MKRKEEPEYIFDWSTGKIVHRSFLDSIIVELSLPGSTVPKQILLHILREAIDESPKDAKRFPQVLWDAMGDFAVSFQIDGVIYAFKIAVDDCPTCGAAGFTVAWPGR